MMKSEGSNTEPCGTLNITLQERLNLAKQVGRRKRGCEGNNQM